MASRAQVDPSTTRIDNVYYDRLGDEWWSTEGRVGGLHAMNPARVDYFARGISASIPLAGARVLDLGCGGGLVAEEMAKLGALVTGVDRSIPSLRAAHRHSRDPRYAGADALCLPFRDATFDALITSDFLEHVHDLDACAREIARVVKPGAPVVFDTINRTLHAWLVVIVIMEVLTKRIPRHTHDRSLFVKPQELRESFARAGLDVSEIRGLTPTGSHLANLRDVFTPGRQLSFAVSGDTSVSFVGTARKRV